MLYAAKLICRFQVVFQPQLRIRQLLIAFVSRGLVPRFLEPLQLRKQSAAFHLGLSQGGSLSCSAASNKKLLVRGASLPVTSALLRVTRRY